LYLSAYFERNRNEYYRLLLAVSQAGQWGDWISFFLRGVAEQSRDALVRSGRLLSLWQEYRAKFQSARSSALQLRLVDQLFAYPAITTNQASKLLKVTHRSAQLNVDKLIHKGILKEVTGKQRNRVFVAPQIVRIIEAQHAS
jgi:Fic family protein